MNGKVGPVLSPLASTNVDGRRARAGLAGGNHRTSSRGRRIAMLRRCSKPQVELEELLWQASGEAGSMRVGCGGGAGFDPELGEDFCHVDLHGRHADEQGVRNCPVGVAGRD